MLGAQALIKTRIPKRHIWKERSAVVGPNGKEAVLSSSCSFHLNGGLRGWKVCNSSFISVALEDMRTTITGCLEPVAAPFYHRHLWLHQKCQYLHSQDKINCLQFNSDYFKKCQKKPQFISVLCESMYMLTAGGLFKLFIWKPPALAQPLLSMETVSSFLLTYNIFPLISLDHSCLLQTVHLLYVSYSL